MQAPPRCTDPWYTPREPMVYFFRPFWPNSAPPSPPGQPCDEQDLLKCAPNKAPCTNSNNVDSHHNNTGRQVNNVFCGIDENFGNLQKQILFGRHEPCTSLFLSASMSEQILCPVRDSPRDGANALARLLPSQIRLKMASPLTHRNIWDMLGPLKIKSVPPPFSTTTLNLLKKG